MPASSLEALDGFCVLAGSSAGPQCVLLIKQVLKHPHIFVFGELLDCASIQQVRPHSTAPHCCTLHLHTHSTHHVSLTLDTRPVPLSLVGWLAV